VSLRVNNKFKWHEPRSFEFPTRPMAAGLAKLCAKGDQGGRRNRMAGCIAWQLTEVTPCPSFALLRRETGSSIFFLSAQSPHAS
jgi:hypothetical protein